MFGQLVAMSWFQFAWKLHSNLVWRLKSSGIVRYAHWYSTICPLVNISDISAKYAVSSSGSISPSWRRYLPPKRRKTTHQSTGCSIPEDLNLHQHRRETVGLTNQILTKFIKVKIFALHRLRSGHYAVSCMSLVPPKLPDCYPRCTSVIYSQN